MLFDVTDSFIPNKQTASIYGANYENSTDTCEDMNKGLLVCT